MAFCISSSLKEVRFTATYWTQMSQSEADLPSHSELNYALWVMLAV